MCVGVCVGVCKHGCGGGVKPHLLDSGSLYDSS